MDELNRSRLLACIYAAEQLVVQLKRLAEPTAPAEDSPEVKEKLARRECLGCGIIVPAGEFYTRGLHKACYGTTLRRFRAGVSNEYEQIALGKISVGGKPGRPAAIDAAEAAEAIAQSIADQIAPLKVAEPKTKFKKPRRSQ